ncbi:peptidyl-alpha-hydroxyglycine alpha-amidating lyase 1 [Diachasma alloeum]|uniref:peptidyl-alpha-hydroxyglycine alpha-amidating lyase 1 n=1 Tax=Diachasma alloeum TaxID=454923 RepID=UPI0007384239|nr:peptidyl-alpha-hydroxyglycine alpha-amidating lyase 1 [Diachasma alloeum]
MTHYRTHRIFNIFVLFTFVICVCGDLQDFLDLQHRRPHQPATNFDDNEFDQEMEETQQVEDDHGWDFGNLRREGQLGSAPVLPKTSNISYIFDPNIKWDKNWTSTSTLGQLSAVDIDPAGNIAIFCRRTRVWGQDTFATNNKFDPRNGPIPENVVVLLNKEGKKIIEWGSNTFYLPHGLTIDGDGNYWLTDVAMHMVLKFASSEIDKNTEALKKAEASGPRRETTIDLNDLFRDSIVKPSLALGDPFEPGNDDQRFCKPTAVAVMKNGDFFVSDGYCNSRVIKFNPKGERISQFGRAWLAGVHHQPSAYSLYVPHALALAEDLGFLYVADRENGRILCFHAQNESFHREYRHPAVGSRVYSVAYAKGRIYTVNGNDYLQSFHVRGYSLDVNSGDVVSQFGPGEDMKAPHDLAVSRDGREIYVVELDSHDVYRFLQAGTSPPPGASTEKAPPKHGPKLLTSTTIGEEPKKVGSVTIALITIISSTIVIGLCIAVAALVARCQKRGCLLSVRRKSYWESDRKENFKLSRVLESRQGKKGFRRFDKRPNTKDFSKLNTEPETSEDERGEESLII